MPADMTGKVRTSLILSNELNDALGVLAERDDRSKQWLILEAIREKLEREGVPVPSKPRRLLTRRKP